MAPPAATRATADHADASTSRHHVEPPPAKRVRREYPWRAEFERDFGVRPIQMDAATGDAVLVECRFCVSFGREPPVALVAPATVNKAGQPIKSRARTRNVAHWKYPFRTDNMRSHHLQQHAHKWDEYTTLLEQTKRQLQEQQHNSASATASGDAEDEKDAQRVNAAHQLNAFFGEPHDTAVNGPTAAIPAAAASVAVRANGGERCKSSTSSTAAVPALLSTITSTAIVDAVLPSLIDIPASDADLLSADASSTESLIVPVKATRSGKDEDVVVAQYSIASGPIVDPRGIIRLLAAGLSFRQVAELASSLRGSEAAMLTRLDVAAYARALVASSLERIAQVLAAVWTYSVRLTVHLPATDRAITPMSVSVCVPVDQSRTIHAFHVATLALHQTNESKENVEVFVGVLLSALDRDWQQKLLSVDVDGATHCLGVHADLVDKVLGPLLNEPVVVVAVDGRRKVDHAVETAWTQFRNQTDDTDSFTDALLQLVASVRGDAEIGQSHPPCPFLQLHDVRSVMRGLKWLLARRDVLAEKDITAPVWWWLVGHAILDVWTDCLATAVDKVAESGSDGSPREVVGHLNSALMEKCGVTTAKVGDTSKGRRGSGTGDRDAVSELVEFDETTRAAVLRVGSGSTVSRLGWSGKEIAQWLRAVNVSTRRMVTELGKDAASLRTTERQVSQFVLLLLRQLQHSAQTAPASVHKVTSVAPRGPSPSPSPPPPPTLPLDYAGIDASGIVDFVETHSRRLERAFPTLFLDLASREIRDLQSLLSSNDALRNDLERVSQRTTLSVDAQSSVFTASWALVPQYPTVRTLAAGLRTAIGMPLGQTTVTSIPFTRADNDQTPQQAIADLAVEACAHARQLERLQRAFAELSSDSDLVV